MPSRVAFSDLPTAQIAHRRVLIREDFNVPMQDGKILNEARLVAALPTLRLAIQKQAKVGILSHLGRPTEGQWEAAYSLEPVANRLSELLDYPVRFQKNCFSSGELEESTLTLYENTRFLPGEKSNDLDLSRRLASLCDIFVMDAFAVAHRSESSTVGVAQYAPLACAGPLLEQELAALSQALDHPKHPVVAIVGGSKVSTKMGVLKALLKKVDTLVLGGGIANTFLAALGYEVGASLKEVEWLSRAQELMRVAQLQHKTIWVPVDVRVAKTFDKAAVARISALSQIEADELILDVGPESERALKAIMQGAGTILWNGPVGVFEFPAFSEGTRALAKAIAESAAYTVAGGGDTVSAVEQFGIEEQLSYISTGGGAFLEWVEGKVLPGVAVLNRG